VELLLLRHPRITEAAVVAMPDPRLGERSCAYIAVQGEPLTMAEVRQHFAGLQVAKFKWPERVEHLADLPRTLVGKTDKKRLQAEIAEEVAAELAADQPRPASTPAVTAGGTP
jgi:non-ribosomal peptide synthetase component E (peptide arylation enzyme)